VTNDQLLRHIDRRLAEGRTTDLQQVVYCTYEGEQLQAVLAAIAATGCAYSILGPDDDGEATVFVQGSPQELKQCVENVGRLLPDGD
jgi:hypothetical protein